MLRIRQSSAVSPFKEFFLNALFSRRAIWSAKEEWCFACFVIGLCTCFSCAKVLDQELQGLLDVPVMNYLELQFLVLAASCVM